MRRAGLLYISTATLTLAYIIRRGVKVVGRATTEIVDVFWKEFGDVVSLPAEAKLAAPSEKERR